jgi:hypothetical protein
MADFRGRRSGAKDWDAYTPYELRNAEALVHLGRRDDALFVLREILGDQRPPGWNQWGEIVWRDPKAPKFIGEMPHGWVAAGFVRAAVALFAYESDDGTLVLAAAVPLAWARSATGVAVAKLRRTDRSLSIEPDGERSLLVEIAAGIEIPPSGIEDPLARIHAGVRRITPSPRASASNTEARALGAADARGCEEVERLRVELECDARARATPCRACARST